MIHKYTNSNGASDGEGMDKLKSDTIELVVVPKRTALLLDKIMVALQKAVDEDSSVAAIPPNMPDSTVCCGFVTFGLKQATGTSLYGPSTAWTTKGSCLLALLLQRGHVFQTEVTPYLPIQPP
uniref:Uncharacterized protein n=1 Tax=Timema shepardi TaxID=629360 RepID=A0A7R9FZ47_TIMSH|nr:unnamed protein product [Timema shepardi]